MAVFVVLALPLMLLMVASVVDFARLVYVKDQVQAAADSAVTIAANTTTTDRNGLVRLRYDAWKEGAWRYNISTASWRVPPERGRYGILVCPDAEYNNYWVNYTRREWRGQSTASLRCDPDMGSGEATDPFPTGDAVGGWGTWELLVPNDSEPDRAFNFCSPWLANQYRLRYTVTEATPTVFLRWFGIDEFTFTVQAVAAVRSGSC